MIITSLQFSKLLVEKMCGAKVEPSFYRSISHPKNAETKEEKATLEAIAPEVADHKRGDDERKIENIPAYLLSDLPAVFAAVGEEQGWGQVYHYCEETPKECCDVCKDRGDAKCHSRGMMREGFEGYISTDSAVWRFFFFRFCEIFADGHNEESWGKAEEYMTEILE